MTDTAIEITADLVRDLLQAQHPDLAGLPIREVVGGWGNIVATNQGGEDARGVRRAVAGDLRAHGDRAGPGRAVLDR